MSSGLQRFQAPKQSKFHLGEFILPSVGVSTCFSGTEQKGYPSPDMHALFSLKPQKLKKLSFQLRIIPLAAVFKVVGLPLGSARGNSFLRPEIPVSVSSKCFEWEEQMPSLAFQTEHYNRAG